MRQEQILTTLYDMALVIGGEDRVEPLAQNTLKRLIYHTGYPVGLFLLGDTQSASSGQAALPMQLAAAMGDYRLKESIGQELSINVRQMGSSPLQFNVDADHLRELPLRQNYYHCGLYLPIPGQGLILLLSPEPSNGDTPFAQIFQPIMANLAKSLTLCRNNEAYTQCLISDRDEARNALQRFRSALDTSNDCIYLIEPQQLRLIDFNKAAEEILGYQREELMAMRLSDIQPDLARENLAMMLQTLLSDSENRTTELRSLHWKKDTSAFPVEIRFSVLRQPHEDPLLIAVARDITERQQAEEQLFEETERAQVTLHSIGDGVITTDPYGYVEYLNPVAEELTGWSGSEARGQPLTRVFNIIHETTREPAVNPVVKCLSENRIIGLANHTALINRFGMEIAIEDSAAPIRNRKGEIIGVVLVFHDVSKARNLAHELSWHASHDPLTGLVNRREFEHRLEKAFQQTQQQDEIHTLLYIDLDHFKLVNDTCGHVAGDELLRQLASHMHYLVRENDTLARLGGDEFGVLLLNCNLNHASRVAHALKDCISNFSFSWEDKTFKVGSSIGIVEINRTMQNTMQIMSNADVACYAAKDHGGNRIHIFQPGDIELARRQGEMRWVSRINEALEQNRLTLFAQHIRCIMPEASAADHYELLLRMYDEQGALISPGSFIPAAERYKLMYQIDRWVIKEALRRCSVPLPNAAGSPLFTINLSGISLNQDGLLNYIREQFDETGAKPQHFCFEVTETAAISNISRAHNLILEVRALGCSFALDDFGSGLSSFTYLKNLPVDYLKIDGSFVKDILRDPIDDSMVSAINKIGHDMGLKTIAEFVESEATLERLKEIGLDYVQGHAIALPIPLENLYAPNSTKERANRMASSRPLTEG